MPTLTCSHASFFPFGPLGWPPLFLPFSRHLFARFSPRKVLRSVELRAQHTWMDFSTKFGSRNLHAKRSVQGPFSSEKMGEIARSKSRIASDLKTRDSNRWRPCDLKLRFETPDWRFVLNIPMQQNCEKGCDLSHAIQNR